MPRLIHTTIATGALFAATLALTTTTAHANHKHDRAKRQYDSGMKDLAAKNYRRAVRSLKGATLNHPIPKYKIAYCRATVVAKRWSYSRTACAAALAVASGTDKRNIQRWIDSRDDVLSEGRAKEGDRYRGYAQWERAIKYYREAIAYKPKARYFAAICEVMAETDQHVPAAKACDEAVKRAKGASRQKLAALAKDLRFAASNKPTAGHKKHLDKVARAASVAFDMNMSRYDRNYHHTYVSNAKNCMDTVTAAEKAGVKPFHKMRVGRSFPGAKEKRRPGSGSIHLAPFKNARPICEAKWLAVRTIKTRRHLAAAQDKIDAIAADKVKLEETSIVQAEMPVADCKKSVAKSLTQGVSPKANIKLGKVSVTLAEAETKVCKRLESSVGALRTKWKAKVAAERAAKLAPFRKVLKGGKMKLFASYNMHELTIYGRKGYQLSTPKQFARARLWFMVLGGEDKYGRATWTLRRFQFRGNRLRRQSERTGRGDQPPTRYYR